ncbi:cathepsin O [Tupaia chinensis]|uniref:cathepsin O n=1 Tax=Tupaia chinensis TaxID=246437 RepID=UPI000FFCB886|nr:cathepsin O [Tupaia chinensis]
MESWALALLLLCAAANPACAFTLAGPGGRAPGAAFQESLNRHRYLNSLFSKENSTAFYGINQFSYLFPEEFKAIYLRSKASKLPRYVAGGQTTFSSESLPLRFDWRDKHIVTPVRNQQTNQTSDVGGCADLGLGSTRKPARLAFPPVVPTGEVGLRIRSLHVLENLRAISKCGACWAFSVVSAVESACAMAGAPLRELSVQQVLDCAYDDRGCGGGSTLSALNWLNKTQVKLVGESEYPFTARDGICRFFPASCPGVSIRGYLAYDFSAQEDEMAKALVALGPLVAVVDAVSWQDYLGGVIQHHCSSGEANHAVLVTGFDKAGQTPYWVVRNSWGRSWGLDGYARVKMGSNICGIADSVSAVLV